MKKIKLKINVGYNARKVGIDLSDQLSTVQQFVS